MKHAVDTEPVPLMSGGHMDTSVDAFGRPSRWSESEGHAAIEIAGTPEGVVGRPTLGNPQKAKRPVLLHTRLSVHHSDRVRQGRRSARGGPGTPAARTCIQTRTVTCDQPDANRALLDRKQTKINGTGILLIDSSVISCPRKAVGMPPGGDARQLTHLT